MGVVQRKTIVAWNRKVRMELGERGLMRPASQVEPTGLGGELEGRGRWKVRSSG